MFSLHRFIEIEIYNEVLQWDHVIVLFCNLILSFNSLDIVTSNSL